MYCGEQTETVKLKPWKAPCLHFSINTSNPLVMMLRKKSGPGKVCFRLICLTICFGSFCDNARAQSGKILLYPTDERRIEFESISFRCDSIFDAILLQYQDDGTITEGNKVDIKNRPSGISLTSWRKNIDRFRSTIKGWAATPCPDMMRTTVIQYVDTCNTEPCDTIIQSPGITDTVFIYQNSHDTIIHQLHTRDTVIQYRDTGSVRTVIQQRPSDSSYQHQHISGGTNDTLTRIYATPREKKPYKNGNLLALSLPFDGGSTIGWGRVTTDALGRVNFSRSYFSVGGGVKALGSPDSTGYLISASAGAISELAFIPIMRRDSNSSFGVPLLFGADVSVLAGLAVYEDEFVRRINSSETTVINDPNAPEPAPVVIDRSWVDDLIGWDHHSYVSPLEANVAGKLGTAFGPVGLYVVGNIRFQDVVEAQRNISLGYGGQLDLRTNEGKGMFSLTYLNSKSRLFPGQRSHMVAANLFFGGHQRR